MITIFLVQVLTLQHVAAVSTSLYRFFKADFDSELQDYSDELTPVRTIQKNPEFNYQGFKAFDRDLSTAANVGLVDNEIWIQFEFDKVYFIKQITLFSYFYTAWFDPTWWCVLDKNKYEKCKDGMSHVTINVYDGSRFVKRCGTLMMSHGLTQVEQIYTFECAAYGNAVVFSKVHSEIFMSLNEIVITTNKRRIHKNTARKLPVQNVALSPPSKWGEANASRVIDNTPWGLATTSDSGPVYIILYLATPSVITEVLLFTGDYARVGGSKVYVISESNDKVPCGVADDATMVQHNEADVYWGEKYPIKCSARVVGKAVRVESRESTTESFSVAEIQVFGYDSNSGMITKIFKPTKEPLPTEAPYTNENIKNNVAPELVENDDGIKEWEIIVEEPIPYKVLTDIADSPDPVQSPLGYLAFAGYVDYSLDTAKASEYNKPAGSGTNKERTKLTQDDLQAAAQSFLRFNGFVEGESITDEMVEYMKKPRCGNADLEYADDEDDCVTLNEGDIRTAISYTSQTFIDNAGAFILPEDNGIMVSDKGSYFYELDVKYAELRNKRSKAIFLGFNYDKDLSNGQTTPLEVIAMRFLNEKLCVQFLIMHNGRLETSLSSRATVTRSCYAPSPNEEKTRSFKIRLDVYNALPGILGKVYITVKGEDVAQNVYKTSIKSAVVTMFRDDHTLTLSRLCKRPQSASPRRTKRRSRNKRYALSNYKWQVDEMKFNFQNYSSKLGQDGTRQGVLKAIDLYSKETGLTFKEVSPTSSAELVFMFIRGKHADGMGFYGAGAEKAHAYSPVHSEIHFNDYEPFALQQESRLSTSLFYVAAHEIGHALGIKHSEKREALMNAGYPNTAFQFKGLHMDDINAVNMIYQAEGDGSTQPLTNGISRNPGASYTPKIPLPKECHDKTDAAISVDDKLYLISGPFVWKLTAPSLSSIQVDDGFPKRVTDVFPQATGTIEAMFSAEYKGAYKIFVIHEQSRITTYNFNNLFKTFDIEAGGRAVRDVLVAGRTKVDKPIKAAFTWDGKTILVTKDLQYYKISWKDEVPSSITLHTGDTDILGRSIRSEYFNAAMTYTRRFKNGRDPQEEVFNFGKRIVFSELVFADTPRVNPPYQEIPALFRLAGWCPASKV